MSANRRISSSLEQGATAADGEAGAARGCRITARPPTNGDRRVDRCAALRRALKALPPWYRMIVVMREMEGLSTREVAGVAGFSEANVKTRLHRARVMLRHWTCEGDVHRRCSPESPRTSTATSTRSPARRSRGTAATCAACAALVDGLRETIGLCRSWPGAAA